MKEKLWASKLKVKDFIQKLYEKDSQLEEKDDKIEELENKLRELLGKERSEASIHQDKDFDEQMETDEEDGKKAPGQAGGGQSRWNKLQSSRSAGPGLLPMGDPRCMFQFGQINTTASPGSCSLCSASR